ncbi:putative ABC transport system substrate-binding protein [Rhizobiales bacterium GAS191]|nr:putative ABC transport system substrate-binding protein [Rhizobiales bacterium GAS191]
MSASSIFALAMPRRAALAAGVAALLLSAARPRAQSPPKMLRVGYVGLQPRASPIFAAFLKRMGELGYQEGKNFTFDLMQIPSFQEFPAAYAELVARGPNILIATGNEFAMQAARATGGNIPIVFFALDFDPFEKGFVAGLARPGGNSTGIFVRQIELAEKRVQLARETLPNARSLGLLWDATSRDQAVAAAAAASQFGFEPRLIEVIGQPPDYVAALARMADTPGTLMLIPATPQFYRDREVLFRLLLERRMPGIGAFPEQAEAGALLSYGVGVAGVLRDVARYVDRIARGAKPADLPIEQPTHFDLTVNLKTAKALGLTIPPSILARADEVIE